MRSILSHFPSGVVPRDIQVKTLREIEAAWDDVDVFVVNLPVASGKSAIAYTLARWLGLDKRLKSKICTPTNILVDQYLQDYRSLHTVKAQRFYQCTPMRQGEYKPTCKDTKSTCGAFCVDCPYWEAKKTGYNAPWGVYNNYIYIANQYMKKLPVVIFDEAHNLIPTIREFSAIKLWQHEYHYPSTVNNYSTLHEWVKSHPDLSEDKRLQAVIKELEGTRMHYLIQRTTDEYRGRMEEVIKLKPVDVSNQPPILWPGRDMKIILLSATLNKKDVEQLGLHNRKILYIDGESPIPAANRPIFVGPNTHSLSIDNLSGNVPALANTIREVLQKYPNQKGFIHSTYGLSTALREVLSEDRRLLFHNKENKMQKYQEYRASEASEGKVLIASGLYEGVDLPEDMGRFQIITKVPWPYLGEPAIKYMAEKDDQWYAWQAARDVLQASGRICRTPTDWGHTFIVDNSFKRLYTDYSQFFPDWYKESVHL